MSLIDCKISKLSAMFISESDASFFITTGFWSEMFQWSRTREIWWQFDDDEEELDLSYALSSDYRLAQTYECKDGSAHVFDLYYRDEHFLEETVDNKFLVHLKNLIEIEKTLRLYKKYAGHLIMNKNSLDRGYETIKLAQSELGKHYIENPECEDLFDYKLKLLHNDLDI